MMKRWIKWAGFVVGVLGLAATATGAEATLPAKVEFNRDVRPILADQCFNCHGPDANRREAELRLDTADGAYARHDDHAAIVPGKPDDSELLRRILHADPEQRMPPSGSGKSLAPRQIALLRKWIEQGAEYQQHWSFLPPHRPTPPAVADESQVGNPIDRFILARLAAEQLAPSPAADRRTLIRRLSFDLLGLPPTPEEAAAFEADTSPQAYERLVDRLLASPHYAERMAVYWLDIVRYADTGGYHSDNHRDVAPYRDYVIQAFHKNKPFDQFTIEQLAGDLLPEPTHETRTASGYNRLLQTTEEGGAQPKEYTAKYAADRVRNTSVIWMGLTLGCAECHNHKFDPFTIKDFYSLQAFFADVSERAVGRQDQTPVPTPEQEQRLQQLDAQLTQARQAYQAASPEFLADFESWEKTARAELAANKSPWTPLKPDAVTSTGGQTLATLDDLTILASGANPAKDTYQATLSPPAAPVTAVRLETLVHDSLANKSLSRSNGNFVLTEVEIELIDAPGAAPKRLAIKRADADFSQNSHPVALAIDGKSDTGWAVDGHVKAADHRAMFVLAEPATIAAGAKLVVRLKHDSIYAAHNIGRFRLSVTSVPEPSLADAGLPPPVADALRADAASRTAAQTDVLKSHFRSIAPRLASVRQQIAALEANRETLVKSFPMTLVTTAVAPRTVRVLPRGNWLDDSGEIVEPATPASLNPLGVAGRRATRLDFARWLVAPENPLTARVFVNRLWKLSFGQGIVRTVEDLGTQGEWPSHPELLDWLAVEFRESGWNVKHLHKLIVMSKTYQQSSAASAKLREADPNNRLLARQSRFRIDAEFVRDNALAASGLLSRKMGGPSVKPYQPAGYWANLNFPTREWQNDRGEDAYRRGLYTYWCRTFPHPSLVAFDAPSREECVAERPRSNTPLQALVLLNDPTYVEAARALAAKTLDEGGDADAARLTFMMRRVLQRAPSDQEVRLLSDLLARHRDFFSKHPPAADELLKVGELPVVDKHVRSELAAWTSVARALLNLHETVTRN
ncbi:MAG: PSD1 and planctomycete cytochrome C domain-containing protein [Pirellulales bacterium]